MATSRGIDRRFYEALRRETSSLVRVSPDFPSAITREKQLKKWTRAWKLELIETANPAWRDLWENLQD
jgi:predicted GIY-YIG superfamily endonuclease